MDTNDIFRRLRYALNLPETAMAEIFALSGKALDRHAVGALLKKADADGFTPCREEVLAAFLDGLILQKRGGDGPPKRPPHPGSGRLTNNEILKKLRIAFQLREKEMLAILRGAGTQISRGELTALFRKPGHRSYKPCGDQFLRNFLKGLAIRLRDA